MMTPDEIAKTLKGLSCCRKPDKCFFCPYREQQSCYKRLANDANKLINEQNWLIERAKEKIYSVGKRFPKRHSGG